MGDVGEPSPKEREELPVVVHKNWIAGGASSKKVVVLPAAVASLEVASQALQMYRSAASISLRVIESASADGKELTASDSESTCFDALKAALQVATTFYGAGGYETARSLAELGCACAEYYWDTALARRSLLQARALYKWLPQAVLGSHATTRDASLFADGSKNRTKILEKISAALLSLRRGSATKGVDQSTREATKTEFKADDASDEDLDDPDADWLR